MAERDAIRAAKGWLSKRGLDWTPSTAEDIAAYHVARLLEIIATLSLHADDCDQGGDCRCGRNQKLREVSGG